MRTTDADQVTVDLDTVATIALGVLLGLLLFHGCGLLLQEIRRRR